MRKILLIGGSSAIGQGLLPFFDNVYWTNSHQFNVCKPDSKGWDDIDIVINLAGLSQLGDLAKHNLITKKTIEVNCTGAVNILAEFLPHMRKRKYGRIILFSSVCSEINLIGHGVYSASKAFIDKLVKIAAIENAQYGITVNSIQLGYTGIGMSESSKENMIRQIMKPALRRFVTMEEIYNALKFIIDTEYYTGQNLRLDGGIK